MGRIPAATFPKNDMNTCMNAVPDCVVGWEVDLQVPTQCWESVMILLGVPSSVIVLP